jgi:hypothetical protein
MEHVRGRGVMHTVSWWGDLGKGNHLEDSSVDCAIFLKTAYSRSGAVEWTVFIRLETGAVGGLL